MTAPSVRKIVLAPNLIGAALIDPAARCVLEAWRDGKFIAVTNRELIAFHLRALNRIGLPAELIKRWAYWLSSPEKTHLLDKQFTGESVSVCEQLAQTSKAEAIICWKYPGSKNGSPWVLAANYTRA